MADGQKRRCRYSGTIEVVLLPPIETTGLTVEKDLMDLLKKSSRNDCRRTE
ncbi:MAG: hypothetical protein HC846_01575 [Blastocatellia bacterium]|nr:hypothetical protein [Blastocatellia bacterium]